MYGWTSSCGSTTSASRDSREATKYEAQPVSSCKNCLKYIGVVLPLGANILIPCRGGDIGICPDFARALQGSATLATMRRAALLALLALAVAAPLVALAQETPAPQGYPGQSNL